MPILFTSNAQEITYRKVSGYLTTSSLFQDTVQIAEDTPQFHLRYGSAIVHIEVLPWEFHPWDTREVAIVRAFSYVTTDSRIDEELMRYLLSENRRMLFGAFQLDDDSRILFSDSVLGGEIMDLMELQACILAVVTIADTYDDIIIEKFGGQRGIERL